MHEPVGIMFWRELVQVALKMARHRCAVSVPPTLLHAFEGIVCEHVAQDARSNSSGTAETFSVNKMLLENPTAAREVGKALGEMPRVLARLSVQFHRHLSTSLAETTTKSVQKLRRHAQRVVAAEVRSPPAVWVEQMVAHCDIVSRCALLL